MIRNIVRRSLSLSKMFLVPKSIPITTPYQQASRGFLSNIFKLAADAGIPPFDSKTDESTKKINIMKSRIQAELNPTHIEIEDVSGGCGAFFKLLVVSEAFAGKAMLGRHRLVQNILKQDISEMHGLTLNTLTPEQYEKQKQQQ